MDKALKQRMVGAAVLVALGVIFLPALFDGAGQQTSYSPIPDPPPEPIVPESLEVDTSEIVLTPTPTTPSDEVNATKSEKVDAGVDTGDLSAWVVQLGSFAEKNNAVELTQTLQNDGFSAFMEPVERDGVTSHRVRIGPEMTLDRANAIRERLTADYQRDSVVMRYYGTQASQ
ncbi:MAG: SPOR domain-containing protein [Pseudomonadota bacterium]